MGSIALACQELGPAITAKPSCRVRYRRYTGTLADGVAGRQVCCSEPLHIEQLSVPLHSVTWRASVYGSSWRNAVGGLRNFPIRAKGRGASTIEYICRNINQVATNRLVLEDPRTMYRANAMWKSGRVCTLRASNAASHVQRCYSHHSLRHFLDTLRDDGDLVDIIHEVDPHLEVGAIARRVSERNAKVPLFHNVKGARNGLWRMVSNLQSLRQSPSHRLGRVARGINLPATASWRDINEKLLEAKRCKPSASRVVETGPCKENRLVGDEIDLTLLPAPLLHQGDGGKYVQSYGMHILQSPDGSWTNWSIARAMVHDRNKLVGLCIPPQHNWQIKQMWKKHGKDVPWALALGVPPAAIIAAGLPIPDGVSELDYVNAITGSAMDLVKCDTNNLLVPAESEIIFEGTLSNTELVSEGPFGEYFGHGFRAESGQMPVYNVDAITYRDDAILPVSVPGTITDESVGALFSLNL